LGVSESGGNDFGVAIDGSGVYASRLIGKIIAGEKLTIESEDSSFVVDGTGATLTNADLTITRSDNKSRLVMNPIDGFRIQGYSGTEWLDNFIADINGDLTARSIKITGPDDVLLFDAKNKTLDLSQFTEVTMGGANMTWQNDSIPYGALSGTPAIPSIPDYITSTKITSTSIESPQIMGGTMAVGVGNDVFKITNQGIQLGHDSFSSAPFTVDMKGRVNASNMVITGGSINIDTDLRVGNNIYLGKLIDTDKTIYLNELAQLKTVGDSLSLISDIGNVYIVSPATIDLQCANFTVNGKLPVCEAVFA
jgi:hypothetical protein